MTRKLATIRRIEEVRSIPDAEKIVAYRIGGWWVVDAIGKYVVGDLVVYAEPDSFIPTILAPFLTKPGQYPRVFEGVEGERLRTIRLRKQLSQGLLLPVSVLDFDSCYRAEINVMKSTPDHVPNVDVTEVLGILKWEAPISAQLSGQALGVFPGWIPKTDQERIQNLSFELSEWKEQNLTWEETEKLDGSSMTAYLNEGEFGVCSRNLNLREVEGVTFWKVARELDLETKLRSLPRNHALQGELIGVGIQNNRYKLSNHDFYIFDIYDIDAKRYLDPTERAAMLALLDLKSVPVINAEYQLNGTMDSMLAHAETKSVMVKGGAPEQEGYVYKCNQLPVSFKVISNLFLLKGGD